MSKIGDYFSDVTGLSRIAEATVWNFHSIDLASVALRSGSNLHNALLDLKREGVEGMVTLLVTSIGRSGRSRSIVEIFAGSVDLGGDVPAIYYTKRHAEIHMRLI